MHASRTWIAFITAGCLTACQALGPANVPAVMAPTTGNTTVTTAPNGQPSMDLGAKHGATIAISIRQQAAFATKGAPPAPSYYRYELRDSGTNAVVASIQIFALSFSFTNVPAGTYYARVDAVDGLSNSIVVGGPQNSSNQVTVTGGSATYTTGFSLTTSLQFIDATGGAVPVVVTNPYPGAVGELTNATTGALLSSYTSGTPNFQLAQVADGTYGFWGFGLSGGIATPARQASNVTVGAAGGFVSGSWNLNIPGLVNYVAGSAAATSLPADCFDVAADGAGNLYTTHTNGVGMIPAASGTYFGQAMQAGSWYRLTGSGGGSSGDNGPASAANAASDYVTINGFGDIILSAVGSPQVRIIAGSAGTRYGIAMAQGFIYRVAGNGVAGYLGDGVLASTTRTGTIRGVAIDPSGNLLINDSGNGRIRRVAISNGLISTIAGGGGGGFANGTVGTTAAFAANSTAGLACDSAGNVFFGMSPRVMTLAAGASVLGLPTAAGQLFTVAGGAIAGNSGDGGAATSAQLTSVTDLAVNASNDLLIADSINPRVRLVAAAGGSRYGLGPLTTGTIYAHTGTGLAGLTGDAGLAPAATLPTTNGIGVDANGNALIAGSTNSLVRRVWTGASSVSGGLPYAAGTIDRVFGQNMGLPVGDGDVPANAVLQTPYGLAMDAAGNIAFADPPLNRVRFIPAASGTFFGQAMTAGRVYTVAGDGYSRWNGENVLGRLASLVTPRGVAFDAGGNLYISDAGAHVVRRLASTGLITTVAGSGAAGNAGDGAAATSATLNAPEGVAVVGGTVYVADTGNHRIRAVSGGTISAVAAGALSSPRGLTADALGNLYIADTGNNRVQLYVVSPGTFHGQTMTAGNAYTATTTSSPPLYVAVDAGRHVYYTDGGMLHMRALNGSDYFLYMGAGGPSGDGGPAASATGNAVGVALGANGRLVFAGGTGTNARVRALQ